MAQFFVHNGYLGWSYGTPADPQLISADDAVKLMELAGLEKTMMERSFSPVQYAKEEEPLFHLTGGNRFLFYGTLQECADINPSKVLNPLIIKWQVT